MPRRQDWSPRAVYRIFTRSGGRKYWLRDLEGDPPEPFWTRKRSEAGIFRSRREAELWARRVGIMTAGRAWVVED